MKIGIIGCGNMGSALARGMAAKKVAETILLHDCDPGKTETLARAIDGFDCATAAELGQAADIIVLALKPQNITGGLDPDFARAASGKLVVSIAAGIRLAVLAAQLPAARLIRVMPNTPAMYGDGVIAWARGQGTTDKDAADFARAFGCAGKLFACEEKQLDAITGLSGSGPAYVFMLINAFAEGGVLEGLPKTMALEMAAQTFFGSARMVLESGQHPEILKDQVTSPGGTTAAGLAALEGNAVRAACLEAVRAAAARSRELGG